MGAKLLCPPGTYGASENLRKINDCSPCPGGKYCDNTVVGNYTGLCDAGFWCLSNAVAKDPSSLGNCGIESCTFGPCPSGGYYCPLGSSSPLPCPAGTYSYKTHLKSADECFECDEGSYCDKGNQSSVTGMCSPGFFCLAGSPEKEPRNSSYGGICPTGTYCPEGSSFPTLCPAGTYINETGKAECVGCPRGFYCLFGSSYPLDCPRGYWCEENATSPITNACPPGTFNNLTQRYSQEYCVGCTPGYYCDTPGKVEVLSDKKNRNQKFVRLI